LVGTLILQIIMQLIIPESDACTAGGSGYLMSIDFDSGLASSNGVFDGNGDGIIDSNDANFVGAFFDSGVPAGSGILGDKRFTPGSGSRTVDGKWQLRPFILGRIIKKRLTSLNLI